ncbi:MAG: OmpA family protein [Bacteroidales bacterium]|nr:OmpA family protein [Bacteroidales bacterium]
MKRHFFLFLAVAVTLASCVSTKKYNALETSNNKLRKEYKVAQAELDALKDEKDNLLAENQGLKNEVVDLNKNRAQLEQQLQDKRNELENMKLRYDTTMENYLQQVGVKNRALNSANAMLKAKETELNEKEKNLEALQKDYEVKNKRLEEVNKALAAKQKEVDAIKTKVSNALVGFQNKGLQVETKDGKVYVSMEDKLMFASGSWAVSKEGLQAIKELAKVLEENKDLNISVEGHTDNLAYNGSGNVKDNWDLSVMRATAIVKEILKAGKIAPERISASGRGEYAPKAPNTTADNRAKNRRTEIILTPKLGEVMELVK